MSYDIAIRSDEHHSKRIGRKQAEREVHALREAAAFGPDEFFELDFGEVTESGDWNLTTPVTDINIVAVHIPYANFDGPSSGKAKKYFEFCLDVAARLGWTTWDEQAELALDDPRHPRFRNEPSSATATGALLLSPDGRRVLVTAHKFTFAWDLTSGALLSKTYGSAGTDAVGWYPDSTRVLVALRGAVATWDTVTDEWVGKFEDPPRNVELARVFAGGERSLLYLGSGYDDQVQIRDAAGQLRHSYSLPLPVDRSFGTNGTAMHPSGTWGASGLFLANNVILWELETGRTLRTIETDGHALATAFSPDGKQLAIAVSGQKKLVLHDAQSGEQLREISGCGEVKALAFSADGSQLVSGGDNKSLKVWSLATGKCLATLKAHENEIVGVATRPDGSILSCDRLGTWRVWRLPEKNPLLTVIVTGEGDWVCFNAARDYDCSPTFGGVRWGADWGREWEVFERGPSDRKRVPGLLRQVFNK